MRLYKMNSEKNTLDKVLSSKRVEYVKLKLRGQNVKLMIK